MVEVQSCEVDVSHAPFSLD